MKFLVVGASGMVGKVFMNKLSELNMTCIGTYHTRQKNGLISLDMTDQHATNELVSKLKPEILIQTAAQPNVDYCEDHREEAWRTNVLGTENLANACRSIDGKHVFISTDYVFDGREGPYAEDDQVNPMNYYATTKVEGERRVLSLENHLVIRTGVVFEADRDSKNFALRVVNELSAGRSLRAPVDQFGNPTLASNLCACVIELAMKNKKGIYHVAGRTIMPRSDFAYLLCKKFGLNDQLIQPVTSEELEQKAKRPKKLGLRTDKAARELDTEMLSAEAAVVQFREKLKQTI